VLVLNGGIVESTGTDGEQMLSEKDMVFVTVATS
jgi:hypothetical protein